MPGGSWVGSPLIRKSVKVKERTIGIPLHALVDVIHETPGHHGGAGPPALRYGKAEIELTDDLSWVKMVSLGTYRAPPDQALYLLLFHELEGVGMCINGRQFLSQRFPAVARLLSSRSDCLDWDVVCPRDHGNCTCLVALVSPRSFECAVHMPDTSFSYEMRQRQHIHGSAESCGFRAGASRH